MSYQAVSAVLLAKEPKGISRLVLVVLAECANKNAVCWPSMATIAERSGISVRHAKRVVHALEKSGHVSIERGNGVSHPNKYRLLNSDTGVTVQPTQTVTEESPFRDDQTVTEYVETVTQRVRNSDIAMSPEPSEPSLESSLSLCDGTGERENDFETFWNAYPRKDGKAAARKAWKKANDRPAIDHILEAIRVSKKNRQWKQEDGRFIPKPENWILDRRWEDISTKVNRARYGDGRDDLERAPAPVGPSYVYEDPSLDPDVINARTSREPDPNTEKAARQAALEELARYKQTRKRAEEAA